MFIEAIFIKPKQKTTQMLINSSHTMEYTTSSEKGCAAIATKWVNLSDAMFSKRSQVQSTHSTVSSLHTHVHVYVYVCVYIYMGGLK